MQMIHEGSRSLGLLITLTWDRLASFVLLALCLVLSAYVASVTFANPFML